MKKEFGLLLKITLVFVVFAFIAFYSSALFLTHEADEFIFDNLNSRFNKTEQRIFNEFKKTGNLDKLKSHMKIDTLSINMDLSKYPIYADTAIYDEDYERVRNYKKKLIIIEAKEANYQIELLRSVDDFLRLREDIFESLIPAFIILATTFILFASTLSGFYFRPFNKILKTMRTYKIGTNNNIPKVKTSTSEFVKMQELFQEMIGRIEDDYKRLKEYTENMAHEIQTPLAIIRSKIENLFASESVMEKHSDSIEAIYNEANHLSKLGSTLNLLTKIENNEYTNAKNILTKEVIVNHTAAVQELFELKSLKIELDLSDSHEIYIDPILLDIIIKNLLSNVQNYTSANSTIRILSEDNSISFINKGKPLPFGKDELFERFKRNTNSNNSLGLGLALVKKICEINNLQLNYNYNDGFHEFRIINIFPS
ncbi:MAG: HAMP domain-containing histidine kinase [Melioribacteraceae bacterium]|nr:HAMP domain-containing histidine kinase [Melioribacteraceae bacterium]MCF8263781.1 HAMP domain-containing histidine kinase [Melioribacteraceae bacterium]MCF8412374.1 HAMP domain-containing histidine kinase [Melioribacteraceae bacterium]MCF8430786.1 HAMP domain-containing histidine kinase [Melioribacteraceae bacterium]